MHEALLDNCREVFQTVRASLETWPPIRDCWSELGKGLRGTYRRARKAFHRAGDRPTSRRLHVWRKHTKYLGYQLELLADAGSQVSKRAKRAREIASLLGEDHDLALLEQRLRVSNESRTFLMDFDAFSAIIRRRRMELQRDACSQAKSLFRHGPKRFTRRVKRIWQALRR
jgi:CHAD domain-containing protein